MADWKNSRRNGKSAEYRDWMTIGNHMQDFTKTLRRMAVCLLCLGCTLAIGCKSGAQPGAEQDTAHPSKKRNNPGTEENAADPSKKKSNLSSEENTADPSRKRVSGRGDTGSDVDTKERYEGGDPDLYRAPAHKGAVYEKVEQTKESTPTPTPNRPIDRPLDPSGKPLPPDG